MATKKKTDWKGRYQNLSKRRASGGTSPKKRTKSRRRRTGGGKIGFTMAGLKRAFDPMSIAVGLVAVFGARGAYGMLVEHAPELDDNIRAAIAAVSPGAVAMVASGKPSLVIPAALGGLLIAVADLMGEKVADAAGDSVPEAVRDALSLGVGFDGRDGAITPTPTPLDASALSVLPPASETGISGVSMFETPALVNVF